MFGGESLRPLLSGLALLGRHQLFHDADQFRQARFGVADQADFQRIVLVQLIRILIEMHQANVFGNCSRRLVIHVLPQQIHADHQQHVVRLQPLVNLRRPQRQPLGV